LTGDVVGLIDALGEKQAVVVGHDWGAIVAWHCLLLHPQRFSAGVALSVPYGGRGAEPLTQSLTRTAGDRFQYIVYFQELGVAEREFDADPRALLSRLFTSPDTPLAAPQLTDPRRAAGGMVLRLGAPLSPPPWLSAADLDHYVNEFSRRGFRGGLNYYRNLEANWHSTPQLASAKITQPVLFMAGDKDPVLRGATRDQLLAMMSPVATDLRDVRLFANTGHWLQQQRAAETSQAIIEFLGALSKQ
jgi:pimeloyl-ACP methyl ester carboxylesterase